MVSVLFDDLEPFIKIQARRDRRCLKSKELICAPFAIKGPSTSAEVMHSRELLPTIALKEIMNGSAFRSDPSDLAVEREILTDLSLIGMTLFGLPMRDARYEKQKENVQLHAAIKVERER